MSLRAPAAMGELTSARPARAERAVMQVQRGCRINGARKVATAVAAGAVRAHGSAQSSQRGGGNSGREPRAEDARATQRRIRVMPAPPRAAGTTHGASERQQGVHKRPRRGIRGPIHLHSSGSTSDQPARGIERRVRERHAECARTAADAVVLHQDGITRRAIDPTTTVTRIVGRHGRGPAWRATGALLLHCRSRSCLDARARRPTERFSGTAHREQDRDRERPPIASIRRSRGSGLSTLIHRATMIPAP